MLENISIRQQTSIADLRIMLMNQLITHNIVPPETSIFRIRIREKIGINPGKILRDGKTIGDSQVYLCDHKAFCFELLEDDEILPEIDQGDAVVQVQKWHRSSWSLSEKIDILFLGKKAVREIAAGLAQIFQIPYSSIRVLVVPRDTSIFFSDLPSRQPAKNYGRSWFDPTIEAKLMRYMSHDMRLAEGDLLLLQDISEQIMELTEADIKSIEIIEAANSVGISEWAPSSSSYYGNYNYLNKNSYGSSSSYSYSSAGAITPSWLDDSYVAGSSKSSISNGIKGSNGIRIKTQKDRMREANESTEKKEEKELIESEISSMLIRRTSCGSSHEGDSMLVGKEGIVENDILCAAGVIDEQPTLFVGRYATDS
jgi:hypothetical protein